jgi:ABC-type hemin transport system substrate-binding protein
MIWVTPLPSAASTRAGREKNMRTVDQKPALGGGAAPAA